MADVKVAIVRVKKIRPNHWTPPHWDDEDEDNFQEWYQKQTGIFLSHIGVGNLREFFAASEDGSAPQIFDSRERFLK